MYNVGAYSQMPSRTEIRKLYADTKAEDVSAAAVENNAAARVVVDDVNSVRYSVRRLDDTEFDSNQDKGVVEFSATPKKLNLFQRATGIGETPVEEIAGRNKEKSDEVSNISGSLSPEGMDVTVSYEGDKEPLVYSKNQDEQGNVFFQRGKDLVTMDVNGNLVMQNLGS